MRTIAFAIAGLLGLFIIIKPRIFWKIKNIFVVKGDEPTKEILIFIKVQGYIIVIISVICIILFS
jgi:hypothetical protein